MLGKEASMEDFQKRGPEARKRRKRKNTAGCLMRLAVLTLLIAAGVWLCRKLPVNPIFSGGSGSSQQGGVNSMSSSSTPPPPVDLSSLSTQEYDTVTPEEDQLHRGDLVLVNNLVFAELPGEEQLVSVYDFKNRTYKVKDRNVRLLPKVMDALNELMEDFHGATGISDVNVISGFRSIEDQQAIMDRQILSVGQTEAARWVAKPGGSEHHTGYALDLAIYTDEGESRDFTGEGAYGWINENCSKYGFIVRYPEEKSGITGIAYEPWHYRYLGEPHAKLATELGLCYEEYIDHLKGYPVDGEHLETRGWDEKRYEIYYVPQSAGQIAVPKDKKYDLSGNNLDGYIITVHLDEA